MNAKDILKYQFGYQCFRNGQEKIIETIVSGHDSLIIMPTGAGKSICYQIPALMLPGITIIISPLISLMHDQVMTLKKLGINAAYINSSMKEKDILQTLRETESGYYKMIYVSPERLKSHKFISFAHKINISMITIDEAHCISQWGYDFRPSYQEISNFIKHLKKRPIIAAFTATATKDIKEDIIHSLGLNAPKTFSFTFDRPNLFISIKKDIQKEKFIIDYILRHKNKCGIIYCSTIKNVERLYNFLNGKNIKVTRYHADLAPKTRTVNQNNFLTDKIPVIIATNAFGMGINKRNVRYVIHYNMPLCIESYYQEAGRAGRDGKEAECILLFNNDDIRICNYLLSNKQIENIPIQILKKLQSRDKKRLNSIINLCHTDQCIKNSILNYFGEISATPCGRCYNCHINQHNKKKLNNIAKIHKAIYHCQNNKKTITAFKYLREVLIHKIHYYVIITLKLLIIFIMMFILLKFLLNIYLFI